MSNISIYTFDNLHTLYSILSPNPLKFLRYLYSVQYNRVQDRSELCCFFYISVLGLFQLFIRKKGQNCLIKIELFCFSMFVAAASKNNKIWSFSSFLYNIIGLLIKKFYVKKISSQLYFVLCILPLLYFKIYFRSWTI